MGLVCDGGSAAELVSVLAEEAKEQMTVDFRLELVIIPVSDVDRPRTSTPRLWGSGWRSTGRPTEVGGLCR
jgi:hypothetical protein